MTETRTFGGVHNVKDFGGSQILQEENQDYCLVCDNVLVKDEAVEEEDPLCLEERGQRRKPATCFGGGGDEFGGVELLGRKFCELFGVTGPVKRWMAVKICDKERSLFCEGCGAQVKILIELKRSVEQLEVKLEEGKTELRRLVKTAEVRGGDELRRSKEIRSIRQQILRERCGIPGNLRRTAHWKRILTRQPVVLISQEEREVAEARQAVDTIIGDGSEEETPMDVSDFQCSSDSEDSSSSSPPRRRSRLSKAKVTVSAMRSGAFVGTIKKRGPPEEDEDLSKCLDDSSSRTDWQDATRLKRNLSNRGGVNRVPLEFSGDSGDDDDDKDEDFKIPNVKDTKKKECPGRYKLKDGVCTFKGVTLRLCDDGNGEASPYKCDTCGDLVPLVKLRHHVESTHITTKCKFCGKVCSFQSLRSHVRYAHGPKLKTTTCAICGRPDLPARDVKKHIWTHFNKEERLKVFAKDVDAGRSFTRVGIRCVCDICGVTLNHGSLAGHIRRVHATSEDRKAAVRVCEICGREVMDLKNHMRNLHSEQKYACSKCENKVYNTSVELRRHVRICQGIKPFKCTMCERAFVMRSHLNSHMKTYHLGLRPFRCDHCEMAFAFKSILQRHTRIYHTEGREPPRRKTFVRGPVKKKIVLRVE